ncbi:MAG: PKD domain-containing protein, partial [Thermoplasmata archaeon]|nr:PKD domain-containing protein [Thermoplasmata archaeon]
MEPLFPTAENKPPEITGMSILPPLQESGLDVNISADIMDDDLVMDAYLEVRLPDMTTTNESMMLEGPSTYYLNATYSQPGTYHFNVSAFDSEGLWNSSGGTFVVVDTTNPWIVDVSASPDVQEVYVPVNISATVQDNDLVSFVSFNISCPDNSWRNLTPSNNAQDLYWEEMPFDTLGQYNGSVTAIDRSGNSNSSSFTFNILDSTSPSILAFQASHSSQEVSSYVNITAVVQDNFALESVFLNVSFPSGAHSNLSMIESTPSEYFLNNTYHEAGDHSATVWATDASGNAAAQSLSFLMVDESAPTITSVSAIPDLQDYGGNVNISAQVSDNHMLEYVRLNLSFPDTSSAVYEMSEGEPGVYYINQSYEFIGVAQFKIEAADPSGNEQTYPGSFEMRDMSPPEIFSAYASPSNQEAGQVVALIADVWDNRQIWGVWVDVIHPDNSRSNNSMNWNETSQLFEFKAVYRMHGLHMFTVWTNDSTDNWNHLENTFTVEDKVPPEIVSVLVSPSPQEIRREVAIDVTAVDNGQISMVYVELEKPESGEIENVSCVSIDGENYSAVFTPIELGTYRLLIYVLDTAGNSRTSETDLQSEDTTPPTADAGGDRIVERGHNVSLDASLSQDNHRIDTYNWTFVDGEETKLLEGVHATYAFSRTGNYSVTLAAKDPSGNVDTDTITLTVKDTIPPTPPQSLAISRGGEPYSLMLSWSANVEDDLDHYVVLRSLQRDGEYEPIGTPSKDSTSFEDTDLGR